MLHKYTHHAFIWIALCQAEPNIPKFINGNDHADTRRNSFCLHRPIPVHRPPMHLSEIRHPKPRLVDVDDVLVFVVQLKKWNGPPLTQHQTSLGVGLDGDLLHLSVDNSQFFHLLPDLNLADFQLISAKDLRNYLINILDKCLFFKQLVDYILDGLFICNRLISLVNHFSENISFVSDQPNRLANICFSPEILFSNFLLWPL